MSSARTELTLNQAIEGMLFYKRAANKSKATLDTYRFLLSKLKHFFEPDDPLFAESSSHLQRNKQNR